MYEALARVVTGTVRVLLDSAWKEGDGGLILYYTRIQSAIREVGLAPDPKTGIDKLLEALRLDGDEKAKVDKDRLLDVLHEVLTGGTDDAVDVLRDLLVGANLPIEAAGDILVAIDPGITLPLRKEVINGLRIAARLTDTQPPSLEEIEKHAARGSWEPIDELADAASELDDRIPFNPGDLLNLSWDLKESKLIQAAVPLALTQGLIVLDDIAQLATLRLRAGLADSALTTLRELYTDYDP